MIKSLKSLSLRHFYNLYKNRIKLFLKLFLVGIFSLFEWQLGYRFFAIFIVIFFITALVCKGKRLFILIITTTIIYFIFNTFTLDALVVIRNEESAFIQHPKNAFKNLLTPNTGLIVLPEQVQVMVSLINANNIESYKLSPELHKDEEIWRRVIESAWQ